MNDNNTTIKVRDTSLDATKGLLILIVIFHHISFIGKELDVCEVLQWNFIFLPLYCSWFMPAFFLISGYCSNFNKPFKQFFLDNMKTLIWPTITSFLIISIFRFVQTRNLDYAITEYKRAPILFFNWFLTALFISRILYWLANKYFPYGWKRLLPLLFLAFIAIVCNDNNLLRDNWFHHRHALYLLFFLYLGNEFKHRDWYSPQKLLPFAIFYIIVVLALMKTIGVLPGVAGLWINFPCYKVPLHIFLALLGTCFIVSFGYSFRNLPILKYIGRNSLVYYLFHIEVIRLLLVPVANYCISPTSHINTSFYDFIILTLSVTICTLISFLLSFKSTRWIVRFP